MRSAIKAALCAVLFSIVILGARAANATDLWLHGSGCSSSNSAVSVNQYGVFNTSSSAVTVTCPVPVTTQGLISLISVVAYDRSSTADVSCSMVETDSGGTVLGTAALNTAGNSGSVQNPQTPAPGHFLSWSSAGHFWMLQCSIPGVTASGTSFLTAYYIGY
jgi:hypothetical protein